MYWVCFLHTRKQLKQGIGGTDEYKRYLVVVNPKKREMEGRERRIRPKKMRSICRNQVIHCCIWDIDSAVHVNNHNTITDSPIKWSKQTILALTYKPWMKTYLSNFFICHKKADYDTSEAVIVHTIRYTCVILKALSSLTLSHTTQSANSDGHTLAFLANACMA